MHPKTVPSKVHAKLSWMADRKDDGIVIGAGIGMIGVRYLGCWSAAMLGTVYICRCAIEGSVFRRLGEPCV